MRKISAAAGPPKVLLRLQQGARQPVLNHVGATPALHVPCIALHAPVQVLDDVRRAQRTPQCPREAEALYRQRLVDPSRMNAAAPGWSRSSDRASRSSTRAARSAESRSHASRSALRTEACNRSGRWPSRFLHCCT